MRLYLAAACLVLQAVLWTSFAHAQILPLSARTSIFEGRGALAASAPGAARASGPSLFAGPRAGLFAPSARAMPAPARRGAGVTALRDLIAKAEAGPAGYDAVQYGAVIRPPRAPTRMSLQEIYDWIDATPGQPHAIGRYQFIPPTLRSLVARLGVSPSARFSPALQDRLADSLLQDAGISRFLAGNLPRHAFMNNLARIWAGLPNDTGKSHYHGYAGNKATMSWATFDTAMARIFPL